MTQTARSLAVLAFGLAFAGTASAQDPDNRPPAERYVLRLQYRHFVPDLTGDARKGTEDSGLVDFNDDLGFASESTFDARAMIQFGRGKKLRGSFVVS